MKTFTAHDKASCSNCGGDFGQGHYSKTKDGNWQQSCERCRTTTTYKLKEMAAAIPAMAIGDGSGVRPLAERPPGPIAADRKKKKKAFDIMCRSGQRVKKKYT